VFKAIFGEPIQPARFFCFLILIGFNPAMSGQAGGMVLAAPISVIVAKFYIGDL
jgi:hypothetical protein